MNPPAPTPSQAEVSRRQFLRRSSLAAATLAATGPFPGLITAHAAPDDPIRIGLIGCGGRGTGAILDALGVTTQVVYPASGYHTEDVAADARVAQRNIQVTALADVFPDRLARCREQLARLQIALPDDHCFTGFDAYQKLLALGDVNYVILAQPPHFRPAHLLAAIQAGKHVFMEKPAAVDAPGIRLVLEAGELAKQKKLGIAAGTQRRHRKSYVEAVKRLQGGAIGEILYGGGYWNGGVIWVIDRQPGWSDMEWQLRNWNYFTWLSGDHVVEQHVHNLDILHWVVGERPVKAYGMGGRQARGGKEHGNIYDHFAVEFEYASGIRMFSQSRQMNRCDGRVEELFVGTQGSAVLRDGDNLIKPRSGEVWRMRRREDNNPYQQEHQDLIASIRAGDPINAAQAVAESTFMAIMGRESAYTGRTIEWDTLIKSEARLGPQNYTFGPLPFPEVPIPGQTNLA